MGDPFVGFVRDPNVEPIGDVDAAIRSSSSRLGVPAPYLAYVWRQESGGNADPAQIVGYNSKGYGGLFGLPRDMLGSVQDQADAAARILSTQLARTGSWESAFRAYSGGGYGAPTGDVTPLGDLPKSTPTSQAECPPGYYRNVFGVCVRGSGGFIPGAGSPGGDPRGQLPTRPGAGERFTGDDDPLTKIAKAIAGVPGALGQVGVGLLVAGVVVGIGLLGLNAIARGD